MQIFGQGEVFVLQQRSPAPLGREAAFAKSLSAWIAAAGFQQVTYPDLLCPTVSKSTYTSVQFFLQTSFHFKHGPADVNSYDPQVILLGSIDASLRTEAQLEGSQLRYRSKEQALVETCTSLGLAKLEVRDY